MKAARLHGANDLRVVEVPTPEPGPGEVLIKVHASGVCPTDIRSFTGAKAIAKPFTPGHEIAGEIAASGSETAGWSIGDRVAVDWRGICHVCRQCRRGAVNFCENSISYPIAGFAEYTVMPVEQLRHLPDPVSYEAASFCEPLACVLNAHHDIPIELGADVLIVGAGPIGLLHSQVAARRGGRVIVVDKLQSRLDVARTLGAHDVVVAGDDGGAAQVSELTEGYGPDAVVVTVGIPAVIQGALAMAGRNATVNLFAGTHPKGDIALNPDLPHYDQVRINGSHDFSPHDFSTAVRLLQLGMVDTSPLVSHRLGLDEIVTAFEITRDQAGLKSIITPTETTASTL